MSLITDDVQLLLLALKCGAAEFVPATQELRFNGRLYSAKGDRSFRDWSRLANVVGRVKLEAAILERGGRAYEIPR